MNKFKLIMAVVFGLTMQTSIAQWQSNESSYDFTGTQLGQQSSFSATRLTDDSNRQSLSYTQNDHEEVTDVFNRNQAYSGLNFTNTSNISASSSLHFSTGLSRDEQNFGGVVSKGNWAFGLSAGQGSNFVKSTQSFTGIDPYFIHGGSATKFNYYGANAGYSFRKTLAYAGSSTVQANQLEDRQVSYIGLESNAFSATYMNFKRGHQNIGKGLEVAAKIHQYRFGYRQISRDNGAHVKAVTFDVPIRKFKAGKIGFAIEDVNNPLFRDNDGTTFMLTLSGQWGKPASIFHAGESDEQAEEVESPGLNKMAIIGAGVVAGALIASSGSSSKDNNESVSAANQNEAARQILNEVNPKSVNENREYGGVIYRNPNGTYSNTNPVTGDQDSVLIPLATPEGTRATAMFHTHAAFDPRYDNENFSPTDINSARRSGLDSYLGTPAGAFKLFDLSENRISQIGTVAN